MLCLHFKPDSVTGQFEKLEEHVQFSGRESEDEIGDDIGYGQDTLQRKQADHGLFINPADNKQQWKYSTTQLMKVKPASQLFAPEDPQTKTAIVHGE